MNEKNVNVIIQQLKNENNELKNENNELHKLVNEYRESKDANRISAGFQTKKVQVSTRL